MLDKSNPPFYRWLKDGVLNTCFNALDRHVATAAPTRLALIYDSPVTGRCRRYTYAGASGPGRAFAGALRDLGVGPATG